MNYLSFLVVLLGLASCANRNSEVVIEKNSTEKNELAKNDQEINHSQAASDTSSSEINLNPDEDLFHHENKKSVVSNVAPNPTMERKSASVVDLPSSEVKQKNYEDDEQDTLADQLNNAKNKNVYTVSKNETLMMVAFKIYGDYSKWRQLAAMNKKINPSKLSEGQKIIYKAPDHHFEWDPEGTPYLIQIGETLGSISHKVYGDLKRWREIWDNNKPLIRNPNVIFAGFTLYYLNKESKSRS